MSSTSWHQPFGRRNRKPEFLKPGGPMGQSVGLGQSFVMTSAYGFLARPQFSSPKPKPREKSDGKTATGGLAELRRRTESLGA